MGVVESGGIGLHGWRVVRLDVRGDIEGDQIGRLFQETFPGM